MTSPATHRTLATDLDDQHLVDARFMDLAAREDLAHVEGCTWTTAPTEIDALGFARIPFATFRAAEAAAWLALDGGAGESGVSSARLDGGVPS